jgi:hypothetical protein
MADVNKSIKGIRFMANEVFDMWKKRPVFVNEKVQMTKEFLDYTINFCKIIDVCGEIHNFLCLNKIGQMI